MNKFLRNIVVSATVWLLNNRLEKSIALARIEAARKLLSGAEKVRVGARFLVLALIMSSMIGAGAVMLIVGASLFAVWKIMYQADPRFYDLLAWIPLGICIGGIISIVPPFIFIFFHLLSERNWMRILRNSKLFGAFISEILDEAQMRARKPR